MDPNHPPNYDEQIAALTARTYRLEEVLRRHGILPPDDTHPQSAQPRSALDTTTPEALAAMELERPISEQPGFRSVPQPGNAEHAQIDSGPSLESRIGSHWFNRIGILAVLISAAWFLKLAIDNHWIGPLGRVIIGLVSGAALIVWSERF